MDNKRELKFETFDQLRDHKKTKRQFVILVNYF